MQLFKEASFVKNIDNSSLNYFNSSVIAVPYIIEECTSSGVYSFVVQLINNSSNSSEESSWNNIQNNLENSTISFYIDNFFPTISFSNEENETIVFKKFQPLFEVNDDLAVGQCWIDFRSEKKESTYVLNRVNNLCSGEVNIPEIYVKGKTEYRGGVNDTMGHIQFTSWKKIVQINPPLLKKFKGKHSTNFENDLENPQNYSNFGPSKIYILKESNW